LQRDPADESFLLPLIARAEQAIGAALFEAARAAGSARSFVQTQENVRAWLVSAAG
jgi:hypothetical protein